jgi:trk system potassium uptake protein TrkA
MKPSQKILILGLGGVGHYLATKLVNEGHSITVIESNADAIRRAEGEIDARLIHGDAMSNACWVEARARDMDYLIAVSNDDAVNILAALIADRYGIGCKIARVRSRRLWTDGALLTPGDLKIDLVIQPEELVAQEVARLLKLHWSNSVFELAG